MAKDILRVDVTPFGPTAKDFELIGRTVLAHEHVKKIIGRGKHRLLGVEAVESDTGDRKSSRPREPDVFRATIFDYSASLMLVGRSFHAGQHASSRGLGGAGRAGRRRRSPTEPTGVDATFLSIATKATDVRQRP